MYSPVKLILISFLCFVAVGPADALLEDVLAFLNNWQYEQYTPNALRHGIEGPGVTPLGGITVGSVLGQYITRVDPVSGLLNTLIPQPFGEADDQVYGKDGTLVWTSLLSGLVRSRTIDGKIRVIGQNNPVTPNGVAFDGNGNCYYSQFPAGTGLYKVDPLGRVAQQFILDVISPMNGFDFDANNILYGPLPFTGQIVKINLATKTQTIVASGFVDVESVRFSNDKKTMYALDIGVSTLYSVNVQTGAKTVICTLSGLNYLDNFRPYGTDGFLLSDTVSNTLYLYKTSTKRFINLTPRSVFALPMGISFLGNNLYIADYVSEKRYNVGTKSLTTIARSGLQPITAGVAAQDVSFGIWNVFASDRYLAFSDFFDGRVQIRSTSTNAVVVATIPVGAPYGLALSSDYKYLIVNDFGTGVRVFNGPTYTTGKTLTTPFTTVTGMAIARDANTVYVADYAQGAVYKVNYVTGSYSTVATGISNPEGIAVYSGRYTDTIFVAAVGSKSLIQINASTGQKKTVATNLPIGLAGPETLPAPNTFTGVAVSPSGDVYITSDLNDALIKVVCTSRGF